MIERTGRWITNSLREGRNHLKKKLNNKLQNLRNEKKKATRYSLGAVLKRERWSIITVPRS